MNAIPIRRPLGCLKTVMRRTRQQNPFRRSLATEITPPSSTPTSSLAPKLPEHTFFAIPARHPTAAKPIRTAFAVYAAPPSAAARYPNPLPRTDAQQIGRMDPSGARTRLFDRTQPDSAKAGDVLMVTTRRAAEPFSGVCLSIRRRGIDTAVLLRGQLGRVGVEMWFKVYSRNVAGIEIIWRRPKRARRARLTYMRKPKHDMGSVDHLVQAWRRDRNVLKTKGKKGHPAKART